jgi:hypothetical protein
MYVRAAEGEQRPRAIGRTHLICHRAAAWGRSELFLVGGECCRTRMCLHQLTRKDSTSRSVSYRHLRPPSGHAVSKRKRPART